MQQEIAQLNTVMAISMLQQNIASKRLAGLTYTNQAKLTDPLRLETLLDSLGNESSTTVKLATIDTLATKQDIRQIEQELVQAIIVEQHPLV